MTLLVIGPVLGGVILALPVLVGSWVRTRRIRRDLTRWNTESGLNVPQSLWAICAIGGTHAVLHLLRSSKAKTSAELKSDLDQLVESLPEAEKARMSSRAEEIRRLQAEQLVDESHREYIAAAAGLGALDAGIMALGDSSEQFASALHSVDPTTALEFLIGHVRPMNALENVSPDLAHHLTDAVATWASPVVDHAVGAGVDAGLGLLGGIADAHFPIATTISSLHRAAKARSAGLDGGRVSENLAWDLGARGGGIAAGAAIGSVVPVVGTLIGGILGGLLGGEIAAAGKTRHLKAAQDNAHRELAALGNSVSRQKWLSVVDEADASYALEKAELSTFDAAIQRPRHLWPRFRDLAAESLSFAASRDLEQRGADLAKWCERIEESSGPGAEQVRGAMLVTRAELAERLNVPRHRVSSCQSAYQTFQDEQEKLSLA